MVVETVGALDKEGFMGRVLGFLAAGKEDPEGAEQKRAILESASKNDLAVEEFFVWEVDREGGSTDFLAGLLEKVEKGDTLLMRRFAHLSETPAEAFRVLDRLAMQGICVTSVEQEVNTCIISEPD